MDINASRGMRNGASEDKIRAVEQAATSPLFDETERAALAYAEAMTITGQRVGDELFARVRKRFSEAQVVELTAAVALENFRSKFNVALGIEAQGFSASSSKPVKYAPGAVCGPWAPFQRVVGNRMQDRTSRSRRVFVGPRRPRVQVRRTFTVLASRSRSCGCRPVTSPARSPELHPQPKQCREAERPW
jgi:hypothetical protein